VAYPGASAQSSDDTLRRSGSIFRSVGISYVQGTVRGPTGAEAAVRFLIDSGATYSLLPEPVWQAIGIVPKREMEFVLADGTTVRRAVSECYLTLPQGEGAYTGRPRPTGRRGGAAGGRHPRDPRARVRPVPPGAASHARTDGVTVVSPRL